MILDAAGSVGAGWPVFSALHAQASTPVKYLAALATLAIAGAVLKLTVDYAAKRSQTAAAATAEAIVTGRGARLAAHRPASA
jgi:hypothetical protein